MRLDNVPEEAEGSRTQTSLCCRVLKSLLLCTGEIKQLDVYMEGKLFGLQLVVWGLRGVAGVILANNPLSGVLILASVFWTSPWQALLGTLGTLISTLTAIIMGQDSVFFHSGLSSFLDGCGVPASVFPFNIVTVLYLLCTGPNNPYYPHYRVAPPWETEPNGTGLAAVEVTHGIILGVGQIYTCGDLGPSLLILGAVLLYSPLLTFHALLGSAIGTLAGLSVAVHHDFLYTGLSGFNGALGCMVIGGLNFTFSWKTHLYAVATAFLSAYVDIALSNLLGTIGLPALSWAATLASTLMLLQNGNLAKYRVPADQVMSPEHNLRSWSQREAKNASESVNAVV
ncbi:urea transporter 1 isoform X2 [Takifugu flavidus]|uniref:urea transporter 1 isoform X2 n=1 Tax=Takifugu flavidus TaxID=433684 RepID=UPI0025444B85|nr:urea transporter 1 isoform X2 [Takifugu flavidus]